MALTPEAVFKYATKYQDRHDSRCPTLREAAKRFRARISEVEEVIGNWQGEGYLGVAVGFQSGGGIGCYDSRGDCRIEAYR